MFINKKKFDDDKFFFYMIDFLCQIEISLMNMLKLLKILDFFSNFGSKFQVFPGLFLEILKFQVFSGF